MNDLSTKLTQILRQASILFLWLNAWVYFSRFVDLWFLGAAFALCFLGALGTWFFKLRFWVSFGIFVPLILVIRPVFFFIISWLSGPTISPLDGLYFWFDRNYLPLLVPTIGFWLLSVLAMRFPRFVSWERLINALILMGVFWFQAQYKGLAYPHPVWQALAVAGFLFIEGFILYLLFKPKTKVKGKTGSVGRIIFTILSSLPLILLLLWFLLTKYEEASIAGGGGLMRPDLFRFDFSQFIKLESEISMSDDLVLLYREKGPKQKRYLRRYLLSGYTGEKGFYVDPPPLENSDEKIPPVGGKRFSLPDPKLPGHQAISQEYYIVNFDPSSLVALNYPVEVIPYVKWDKASFVGMYEVHSKVLPEYLTYDAAFDPVTPMDPSVLSHYTDYAGDKKIKTLAEEVAQGESSSWDKAVKIQKWLQDMFYYSLKPGIASDGNQLHHFLFESRKGYCSYFAFSMTLMLRSLGVPSRVAVGFFTQPDDELMNFYPVRANQAHAWVEVYFGQKGWITFDPTSPNLAPGEEFNFSQGLPIEEFSKYITEILKNTLLEKNEKDESLKDQDQNPWQKVWDASLKHFGQFWYLYILGFYALGLGLYHGLRFLGPRWGSARKRMARLWRLGVQDLKVTGFRAPRGSTALDLVERLPAPWAPLWDEAARTFLKSRFGPEFTQDDVVKVWPAVEKARGDLKKLWPRGRRIWTVIAPWVQVFVKIKEPKK